jgi:hypothetical protein
MFDTTKMLGATILLLAISTLSHAAGDLKLEVVVETPNKITVGQSGVIITIVANDHLVLGSTDITLNWDAPGIRVDSVFSATLNMFVANINNENQTVRTASATGWVDAVPAGTPLMIFSLTANEPGVYNFYITDGDNMAPDDLAGPVPPIPPISIAYTAVDASVNVRAPKRRDSRSRRR